MSDGLFMGSENADTLKRPSVRARVFSTQRCPFRVAPDPVKVHIQSVFANAAQALQTADPDTKLQAQGILARILNDAMRELKAAPSPGGWESS